MNVQFSHVLHKAYPNSEDIQNDSKAHELIGKVNKAVVILLENKEYFEGFTAEDFKQLATDLDGKEIIDLSDDQQEKLHDVQYAANTFLTVFQGITKANAELDICLFTDDERQWLSKETPSIQEYIEPVQTKCKEHLKEVSKALEQFESSTKVFREGLKKLKPWLSENADTPSKNEPEDASKLQDNDLISLSNTLKDLHAKKERMEKLTQSVEKIFKQLSEGQPDIEAPTFDTFQALRHEIVSIDLDALSLSEVLVKKVLLCSRVAGAALKEISKKSKELKGQLQAIKDGVPSEIEFTKRLQEYYQIQMKNLKKHHDENNGKMKILASINDLQDFKKLLNKQSDGINWKTMDTLFEVVTILKGKELSLETKDFLYRFITYKQKSFELHNRRQDIFTRARVFYNTQYPRDPNNFLTLYKKEDTKNAELIQEIEKIKQNQSPSNDSKTSLSWEGIESLYRVLTYENSSRKILFFRGGRGDVTSIEIDFEDEADDLYAKTSVIKLSFPGEKISALETILEKPNTLEIPLGR